MSRSSTDQRGSGGDYAEAWRALHRLVRRGNSFNGHERNVCFLNVGPGRFADASAVSGFDYADDGRALAVTDWDQDGHLDLWVSNRTGPRVRFLHNAVSSGNGHVALRLRGRSANRDGIGARVEVFTTSARLVRSLAAGSGFLSQSSKWLHFGLGRSEEIERLVVHWPGGESEEIDGVRSGGRYVVGAASGEAREAPPRARRAALGGGGGGAPPAGAPSPTGARTVLAARLELPEVPYVALEGGDARARASEGSWLLVDLWAIWCRGCTEELSELAERADELRAAGLDVLTLGTDGLQYRFPARRRLGQIGWPFRAGWSSDETLGVFRAVQMALLENHGEVVLPTSLLLDPRGRLVALYRGRVDVDRLLADVGLPDTPEGTRDAAAAFDGRWSSPPPEPPRSYLAGLLSEHGLDDLASEYVASIGSPGSGEDGEVSTLAVARALLDEDRPVDAEAVLRRVLRSSPNDVSAHLWLARSLRAQNRFAEATQHYEQVLAHAPDHAAARDELARLRAEREPGDAPAPPEAVPGPEAAGKDAE